MNRFIYVNALFLTSYTYSSIAKPAYYYFKKEMK